MGMARGADMGGLAQWMTRVIRIVHTGWFQAPYIPIRMISLSDAPFLHIILHALAKSRN